MHGSNFNYNQSGLVRRSTSVMAGRHELRGSPERAGAVGRSATLAEMHAVTAYATPPDVRRALSGAPHTAGVDRAGSGLDRGGSGGRRHSQAADFDSYNGRSIATTLGLESQFSRANLDDSSMYAHTPGRDAMALVGRRVAADDSPSAGRHTRGGSVVSPAARARAIEDTRNALGGGTRHTAASDSFGWGTPDAAGRARTGSVASARLSYQDQGYRANALAMLPQSDHPHRASYAGSAAPSAVGSASAYRARAANSASASGTSATRRARRHSSQQLRGGKTPIRSNWYHQDEMLHEGELDGQDFASSDEEDFGKDGDYAGNMVAQQRLIENQHRQIFDLGMRNKILEKAMADKCGGKPYEALADDLGRTCASNRKANRAITQLTGEVEDLQAQCRMLQDQAARPPVCRLAHGMSDEERAHMEELGHKLSIEISVNGQLRAKLDEKDALYRDMQEKLDRELLQSEYWRHAAAKYNLELAASGSSPARQSVAAATAELLSNSRTRAGTATTMSESVTLRAPSDMSVGGAEDYASRAITAASGHFDVQGKQGLLVTLENLESTAFKLKAEKLALESQLDKSVAAFKQTEAELKHARKKVLELEEDRRTLQSAMKCSEVNLKAAGGSEKELAKLAAENDELRDQCDMLQREIGYANGNLMAAVSSMDLARGDTDGDDIIGGGGGGVVTLRAENAKLKVECRDLGERYRVAAEHAENLKRMLEQSNELIYNFKHDDVRKFIRESTVGPAQAEAVRENCRQWSQVQVVVAAPGETYSLTRNRGGSSYHHGAFNSAGSSPEMLAHSDDSFVYEMSETSPPPAVVPKPLLQQQQQQQHRRPLSSGMFNSSQL